MQLNEEIGLSLVPQISTLLAEPLSADNSSTWNIATKCVNELIAHVCKPAKNASNGEGDSVDRNDTEDMDMNVDVSINSARRHEMAQMFASQLKEMLGFKCARVWNLVLDVIGCTYESMGKSATPVMDGVFSAAVQLYATPEFHARQSMMAMVGKACKAIGPEALFTVRPLNIDASVATDEFPWAWLLVAINGNVERTELAYFATTMLPLATDMGVMAEQLKEKSGHAEQAATYHKIHRQIWSLFTGFCTRPTDVCSSFPLMARTLGEVIRQRPDLRVLVCDGLRTIIETTCMSKKSLRVGVVGLVEGEADPHATDRAAVAKFAKNFLPLLFNAYAESASQEMKASVLKCLERYAAIADPQLVNTFFANVMKKLLQSSAATPDSMDTNNDTTRRTVEQTAQMHTMMNLAFALLNYLNADSLGLYYKVLCPQLLDRDPTLQKLSYQSLCAVWDPNAPKTPHQEFAAVHRADLREALSGSYLAVAGAAKKQRLRILSLLVDQASPVMHGASELEIIPAAVTEAILSTKEVNEKTRELAYRLLVTMGTAMIRAGEAQATFVNPMGERVPASLDELILMIVAGLGGTTPHMISASVMSLGRLFFEFSTQLAPAKRDELLQTMLMMLKTKNREIAKSMLAFFKICIVCVSPQVLGQYLPTLLDTLMGWPDDQKQHFKMKIRFLLERLIRKYGLDEITNMMPEKDRKLVANIRKRKEQDLRKQREEKDARREYAESKNPLGAPVGAAKTKAQSFEDILYGADSDDSDAEDDGNAKTAKKEAEGATWLKGDTADGESEDVLDFLDASAVNRMVTTDPARMGRRQKAHWSEYDADGKMLVEDPEAENGDEEDGDSDNAMEIQDTKRIKGQKRNRDNTFDMSGDQDDEDKKDWNRSKRGGAKHNAGKNDTEGQQYGSKKASGDMRRKGNKFEPFAYVALDKKNINKRHTNKAAGTFKAVMSKKHKRN
ncbi:hypothetical protein SARC_06360 [Sphaeroforma arctica JP610]|uniref:RRP12 HEAT domain-containing protein n=1 Tax=Sphaeroforma arctica JP610 TaxID=667725 RepID=A0A0L0FWT7_9EUKA|nr:hypothetical protein SARC_06360 [Sphaeroforma arctica JP610]KNC81310.1 hypothetical protein SARC_06360 [Sphaeroforma arctica JP610]|eukprot:XP_014155212.1 hypothetical protein SARC_06360 [Sphaeroforma arctica JP610]